MSAPKVPRAIHGVPGEGDDGVTAIELGGRAEVIRIVRDNP